MEPIKREDIAPELAQEIEDRLKEMYPGFEVRFVGDEKEIPPKIISSMDQHEAKMRDSLLEGVCVDCGKKIPGEWPPETEWPEGWSVFDDTNDEPLFLVCPECDSDDRIDLKPMD